MSSNYSTYTNLINHLFSCLLLRMESSRLGTGTELEHNRETGLVQAEDDFFVDKRPFISWVGSQAKFSLILLSYSAAFLTMVKLGFWMADTATTSSLEFHEIYNNTPVLGKVIGHHSGKSSTGVRPSCVLFTVWLGEMMEGGDWLNSNVLKAAFDLCLLSLFVLQHTLLSSRILKETRIWYSLHHQYKMDKPLYTFTTALALMVSLPSLSILILLVPHLLSYFYFLFIL